MNSKTKMRYTSEKGITLIALVITIIVLLILAGVTISMVLGDDGIIAQAQQAKEQHEKAEGDEKDVLQDASYEIAKRKGDAGSAGTSDEYALQQIDEDLEIGDIVNYTCGVSGYEGAWKVLGVESGKVLLLSTESIGEVTLTGKDAYYNGINQLNKACEPYGKGVGAEMARCITAEDINQVTRFNPAKTIAGVPNYDGLSYEYGNVATYTMDGEPEVGELKFTGSNGFVGSGNDRTSGAIKWFRKIEDGVLLGNGESYKVTNNWYDYAAFCSSDEYNIKVEDGIKNDSSKKVIMAITQKERDMLIGNGSNGNVFWLANQITMTQPWSATYGLFEYKIIGHDADWRNSGIQLEREHSFFSSRSTDANESPSHTRYLRAVVVLDDNYTLEPSGTTGEYNIKLK